MTIVAAQRKKGWVRWLKRIVLAGVALVVLLVLAGTVYEWSASPRTRAVFRSRAVRSM